MYNIYKNSVWFNTQRCDYEKLFGCTDSIERTKLRLFQQIVELCQWIDSNKDKVVTQKIKHTQTKLRLLNNFSIRIDIFQISDKH